jgi:hypothetical protein
MKTPEEMAEEFSKVNATSVGGALGCYRQGLFEGFLAGYNAAAPKWISVEEKLPQQKKLLLLFTKREPGYICIYTGRFTPKWGEEPYIGHRRHWNVFSEHFFGEVTHWMPLPALPECKE